MSFRTKKHLLTALPAAPVKTGNPSISGTPQVGQTLTASHGTYTGSVTGYSGQWYSGASPIALATGLTYVPTIGDLGNNITYQESTYNTNLTYSSAIGTSNALGPVVSSSGTLSAPTLGYPSPIASNPATVAVRLGADWQTGDVLKLARSPSASMTSPTILTHTLTDADITAGTISIGLSGITLAGITYFQAYGAHSGVDSSSLSNVTAWGDTTAPTITTATTFSTTELTQLAITLAATDTGGVPAFVSDGTTSGWYISGGADQLQFQIAIIAGVPTLQIYNDGTESYSAPSNSPANANNPYNVQIIAVDYSGNQSAPLSEAVTFTQIDSTPNAYSFTNVSNAPLSTVETSNTVTISGLQAGFNIPATFTGSGTYSKNGGAYVSTSPLTAQNGDTFTLRATSGSGNNMSLSLSLNIGTATSSWTVSTPVTTTTFNPTDKSGNITLSNGNLTAQNASGLAGPNPVRTVASYSTGKHVVRFLVDAAVGWYGIEDGTQALNNYPASSMSLAHDGSVFVGSGSASSLSAAANGDTVDLAFDMDAKKAWLRKNSTWHTTCGDPTASGAGFDISGMASTLFVFTLCQGIASQTTLQSVTLTGFTSVI